MDANAAFPVTLFIGIATGAAHLEAESDLLRITDSAATDDRREGNPSRYVLLGTGAAKSSLGVTK